MERLAADDQHAQQTAEHLESFANDGLRTLCLGYRTLTNEEYNVNNELYIIIKCLFRFQLAMVNQISRSIHSN